MSFQYAEEWLAEPGARAISLSLPLQHGRIIGSEVYNFFSNLLPDSEAIIDRIQVHFKVKTDHPFDLLAAVGPDVILQLLQLVEESAIARNVTSLKWNSWREKPPKGRGAMIHA